MTVPSLESRLVFVPFFDPNEVIGIPKIQRYEDTRSAKSVQYLQDQV
jgi:hypothetical protein